MEKIALNAPERFKLLANEISILQKYNSEWLKIHSEASDDDMKTEASNAIKKNNDLIGEKTDEINRILQGDVMPPEESGAQTTEESSFAIVSECKAAKIRFPSLPMIWRAWKTSAIKLEGDDIKIITSEPIIGKRPREFIQIFKEEISTIDYLGSEIQIRTKANRIIQIKITEDGKIPFILDRLKKFHPLEDRNSSGGSDLFFFQIFSKPIRVTPLIATLNLAIFALMAAKGYGLFMPDVGVAIDWGANSGGLTLSGDWWRLAVSMFLHYGVLHLTLNTVALLQTGEVAERLFGSRGFLELYIFSGIIGGIASLWFNPWKAGLGASGAIFGIVGGATALALFPKLKPPALAAGELIKSGSIFFAINYIIGLSIPSVDNAAHLGGFIGGAIGGIIIGLSRCASNEGDAKILIPIREIFLIGIIVASYFILIERNEDIKSQLPKEGALALYDSAVRRMESKDYEKSMALAIKASDLGSKEAPGLIGYFFSKGLGMPEDVAQAIKWLKLGSDRNDPYAQFSLYKVLKKNAEKNYGEVEIFTPLIEAAKSDYIPAIYELEMHILSKHFKDGAFGDDWVRKRVEKLAADEVPAFITLRGWALYHGYGVQKNISAGQALLERGFSLGAKRAGEILGSIYSSPDGDQFRAFTYYLEGARRADPKAQYKLGQAYRQGLGIPINLNSARYWLKRAADQNSSAAAEELMKLEKGYINQASE